LFYFPTLLIPFPHPYYLNVSHHCHWRSPHLGEELGLLLLLLLLLLGASLVVAHADDAAWGAGRLIFVC